MVLDLFGKSRSGTTVGNVLQRHNYEKAIVQIRAELQKRKKDERLRLQLADLLAQAGRKKEAVEVLNQLSDDLAWDGFAAKAIAVLKKIEKLDPGRAEVEEKLAYLINQKSRPNNDPWAAAQAQKAAGAPAGDMEEIGLDLGGPPTPTPAAPAPVPDVPPAPGAPPVVAAPPEPVDPPPPAASETVDIEFSSGSGGDELAPEVAELSSEIGEEAFRNDLLSLIEDVFVTPPAPPTTPAGDGSPMVDTPLFRNMSPGELVAVIRKMRLLMYEPGEIIVGEGEPGDSLFIITTGRVRAYVREASGKPKEVRQLGEGDFFGEISILDGGKRTATVTAAGDCELLEFDKASLDEIAQTHPRMRDVMREFAAQRGARTGS